MDDAVSKESVGAPVVGGAVQAKSMVEDGKMTELMSFEETGKVMFLVERGQGGKFIETVYATFDQGEAADFLKALPVGEDDYAVRRVPAWEMRIGDQVLTSVDVYRTMMNQKATPAEAAAVYDVESDLMRAADDGMREG